MVEGPGCKLKGEKMKAKVLGQVVKEVSGECAIPDFTCIVLRKQTKLKKRQKGQVTLFDLIPKKILVHK